MTTAPETAPRCETYFDSKTRRTTVRYFNCNDENAENRARSHRIEQITKQLAPGSGRTKAERKELHKERNFLQRLSPPPPPSPPSEKEERKLKATEKKLRWLAKKMDAQTNLHES
jgi:hypothetical protein